MLKLKELKAMVPETGKMDRVPTYKKLRESGYEIVVKEVIDQDTEVMVYDKVLWCTGTTGVSRSFLYTHATHTVTRMETTRILCMKKYLRTKRGICASS